MTASEETALDPVCCEFCGLPIDESEREQRPALDKRECQPWSGWTSRMTARHRLRRDRRGTERFRAVDLL